MINWGINWDISNEKQGSITGCRNFQVVGPKTMGRSRKIWVEIVTCTKKSLYSRV